MYEVNCFVYVRLMKPEFQRVSINMIIVRLSLLTMTSIYHMREMLLFVCSKMADQTNSSSKLPVADGATVVRARQLC